MGVNTEFIDELASAAPTPGGGGASAYVGALSAALASMVGNLTVGKKTYAAVEPQVREALAALGEARADLLALVEEDARAFGPLSAVYRMPKDTPEQLAARNDALQAALVDACEVPLSIMQRVSDVVELIDFMAHNGSRLALSDAGVAAAFARAAADGASLNIYINIASMDDAQAAEAYRARTDALACEVRTRCDELFAFVKERVS